VPSTTAMRRCAEGLSAQTPHGLPPTLRDGLWTYSLPPCDPISTDVATGSPPRGLQTTFATDPFWYTSEVDLLYPPPKVPIVCRAKCPKLQGPRLGGPRGAGHPPAAASPSGLLPTRRARQGRASPCGPAGSFAARSEHRHSGRPCHPRAISSGHERYPADSHGQSDWADRVGIRL
jgi:hypothetical protein